MGARQKCSCGPWASSSVLLWVQDFKVPQALSQTSKVGSLHPIQQEVSSQLKGMGEL